MTSARSRRCEALGLYWCAVGDAELTLTLRLARDAAGAELLPTPTETRDAERAAKEAALAAKEAALARVAELEARFERER